MGHSKNLSGHDQWPTVILTPAHSALLFFKSKIVKLLNKIKIENCLFISKYVNKKLPPIFNSWFIFSSTCHNYETSFAAKGHLKIPTVTTSTYGKGAFISMATETWNNTQSQIKDLMMYTFSPNKLKIFSLTSIWIFIKPKTS